MKATLALWLLATLCALPALAFDWPRFRGPEGTGVSSETGLLDAWPAEGAEMLWQRDLGRGFSGISVVEDGVFTLFANGDGEFLIRLDAASGGEKWRYRLDGLYRDNQGDGPRSTPTVDDGIVYAYGARSVLVAVDANSGKALWSQDLKKSLGARPPRWGTSAQPLVVDDLVLVDVGGRKGASIAAFKKLTGVVAWTTETDKAGYSTPLLLEVGGRQQVIFFTASQLVALDPGNGDLLWKHSWSTSWDVNAAAPIAVPPNGLFVSSGYDTGSAFYRLTAEGERRDAVEVWRQRRMKNKFSSSVLYEGHLYGFDNSILKCLDAATGEERWKTRGFEHGSLTLADGKLFILGEGGRLALAEASPESYRELSSFQLFNGKSWTVPTLAHGKLFLRDERQIVALDVAAGD
ncbi:MAG: PQQ-binding-like beta-propeller repeat protein [Acidobacteriota bacterium]